MSTGRFALAALLVGAAGCAAITHPARVEPGTSSTLLVSYDRQRLDPPAGPDRLDDAARVQLTLGYGRHRKDENARYAGVIMGAQLGGDYDREITPYLAIDLYYQRVRQESAGVDAGFGVLLGYYSGAYGLIGRELGRRLRVDAGARAMFGVDLGYDLTPHLLVTGRSGRWSFSAYGEWIAFRSMPGGPIDLFGDPPEDSGIENQGDFSAGLVVGYGL